MNIQEYLNRVFPYDTNIVTRMGKIDTRRNRNVHLTFRRSSAYESWLENSVHVHNYDSYYGRSTMPPETPGLDSVNGVIVDSKAFSKWMDEELGGIEPMYNSAAIEKYRGLDETMRSLAKYSLVRTRLPLWKETTLSLVSGNVRVLPNEFTVDEPIVMNMREFRRWLAKLSEEDAAIRIEPDVVKQPVLEWLEEKCDTGVFSVAIDGQKVPARERTVNGISDWRYYDSEGKHINDRVKLLFSDDKFKQAVFLSGNNKRAWYDLTRIDQEGDGELLIDVTREFGWIRGMFGDDGSCYWNEYNISRTYIYSAGGYAIRLWSRDGTGLGRAWIVPTGEGAGAFCFNAYGSWNLHRVAALLEFVTGESLAPAEVQKKPDRLYVNGNSGYAFGNSPQEENTVYVNLRWKSDQRLLWDRNPVDWEDYQCTLRNNGDYGPYNYEDYYTPRKGEKKPRTDDVPAGPGPGTFYCDACDEYIFGDRGDQEEHDNDEHSRYWCSGCGCYHDN